MLARTSALAAFALLLAVRPAAGAPPAAAGTLRALEVTAFTREQASLWVRAVLPHGAKGPRQTFEGDFAVAGTVVPAKKPVVVTVQPGPAGDEVVFFLDVPFSGVPEGVLRGIGPKELHVSLRGTLHGDGNSSAPVSLDRTLKAWTPELVIPGGLAGTFVRPLGAHLSGVSFSELKGEVSVALFNPLGFDIVVRDLTYEVRTGSRVVASGSRRGLRIRAGRENELDLPVASAPSAVAATAGEAIKARGTIEGRLVAKVVLKLGGGDVTIPVDLPATVQVTP